MKIGSEYQSKSLVWGEFFVVLLLLFLLDLGGWFGLGRKILESVIYPFSFSATYVDGRLSNLERRVEFTRKGAFRIVELEEELAGKDQVVSELYRLKEENESLKEQVGVLGFKGDYLMGKVVEIESEKLFLSLKDGEVLKGDEVYFKNGLLGKVESVGDRLVRVVLLKGMEGEFEVSVLDENGDLVDEGVLQRDSRYGLILRGLEKSYGEIENGVVVAKGSGGQLSEGALLGRVKDEVESKNEVLGQVAVKVFYEPKIGDFLYIKVER